MPIVTAEKLFNALQGAAKLRGQAQPSEQLGVISLTLVLKWAYENSKALTIPEQAQWPSITATADKDPRRALEVAQQALQHNNVKALGEILEILDVSRRLNSRDLEHLVHYFDEKVQLHPDLLEFPDAAGEAYDQFLSWSAEQAGKMGGEFHTPRSVGDLLVRLTSPSRGQSVYDPFAGSAGMLLRARQYVSERDGIDATLDLFGQEINRSTYALARLNLLLHGYGDASLTLGNTLTDPRHVSCGKLLHFDRVLTNPPMAMEFVDAAVQHQERMKYGITKGRGKADLMNLQHVVAVLKPTGVGAMIAPHGALFRGGVEGGIRRGIIEDGHLAAVIGIGANVFYGTAVPACVIVVRGTEAPRRGPRDEVLFINAEREVATGRTQNVLKPQHIERIVRTYESWSTIPGFSRPVSISEIADNGFNLNIGRYVEALSSEEPQLDVRAAIAGGVPRAEVESKASRFRAFGIDAFQLFQAGRPGYLTFLAEGYRETAVRIQHMAAGREREFKVASQKAWKDAAAELIDLAGSGRVLMSRDRLMALLCAPLTPLGLVDTDALAGAFASWWEEYHNDLRSLDHYGLLGLRARRESADNSPSALERKSDDDLVMGLGEGLLLQIDQLVAAARHELTKSFLGWGDRYALSLADLEKRREDASACLQLRLREMGLTDSGYGS
ncbi:N-6 DNA methylase [Micromonospora sp. 4G57]|uniref:site-specific DNA-methyltransferase (adenine-specific) n=1 Tax=Micromonospora sicca TaxID=2202420 RepID=A0ABU5JN39_9ACTN|nr:MULTISPECIES: N-6 DNA methylase [unclassified Micromonospora]MDZ5447385.1 N-6 DNA methylase [Micromonospora sp. 4G57]MDZ5494050.1 N-6 DNA methylase [Micromonospora sp. 4G53]